MGSFGDKLKREREMRAITLEEIAAATKIGSRSLKALEEEEFDQLPGGIFNKGFVRAYARYLGIDEEQAVSDYLTACGEPASKGTDPQEIAQQVQHLREQAGAKEGGSLAFLVWVVALVILCGAAFGAFKGYEYWKQRRDAMAAAQVPQPAPAPAPPVDLQPVTQQPVDPNAPPATTGDATQQPGTTPDPNAMLGGSPTSAASTPAAAGTAPATTTPATTAPASATTPPATTAPKAAVSAPIVLEIQATKRAWVSITADGKRVFSGTLDPSDDSLKQKTVTAKSTVKMTLGNPAGLEISFNGKSLGKLGPEGQRRDVTITPDGISQ